MHNMTRRSLLLWYYLYHFSRGIRTDTTGIAVVFFVYRAIELQQHRALAKERASCLCSWRRITKILATSAAPQYAAKGVA